MTALGNPAIANNPTAVPIIEQIEALATQASGNETVGNVPQVQMLSSPKPAIC